MQRVTVAPTDAVTHTVALPTDAVTHTVALPTDAVTHTVALPTDAVTHTVVMSLSEPDLKRRIFFFRLCEALIFTNAFA